MDLPQHKCEKKPRSFYKDKAIKCLQIWLKDKVALVNQKLINWKQSVHGDYILQNAPLIIETVVWEG
jgi:hypothetical protein